MDTLAAGAVFGPEGLSLTLPASLTMTTAAALPAGAIFGVTAATDGSALHQVPATRVDDHTIAFDVTHFSIWAGGVAGPATQAAAAAAPQGSAQAVAEQALASLWGQAQANGLTPNASSMAAVLQKWFDDDLHPRLIAQDFATAEDTFADAIAWAADVKQNGLTAFMASAVAQERYNLATFLGVVTRQSMQNCNANSDYAEAIKAVRWFSRVQSLGLETMAAINTASFRASFCVHVQVTGNFGPMTSDGVSGVFDAAATYTIGAQGPQNNKVFHFTVTPTGGNMLPEQGDSVPGQGFTTDTAPTPPGTAMSVSVEACMADFAAFACENAVVTDTLTPPCGHLGIACCGGGACNGGTTCQAGTCQLACGAPGLPCCNGTTCNANALCQGTQCVACGSAAYQQCCNGACGAGFTCQSNLCLPCGDKLQACCAGGHCNPGYGCYDGTNTCEVCGTFKLACCEGTALGAACSDGSTCTVPVHGTIYGPSKRCWCGTEDDPCCPAALASDPSGCPATGFPTDKMKLECKGATCKACGNVGAPCCTSGPACTDSANCSGGCVHCGNNGEPCCTNPNIAECASGYCASGTCAPCGNAGQACCPVTGGDPWCNNGTCAQGSCP